MAREIITTVERRRRWPDKEKLRILSEALVPGATAAAVADRNGVDRSLLYMWLRLAREGHLPGIPLNSSKSAPPPAAFVPATFMPVRVQPPSNSRATAASPSEPPAPRLPNSHTACAPAAARRRVTSIEVMLANGRTLKADERIDPDVLARLAAALEGAGA